MSALSIQVPFPVFQDRDGQPLDNGYVWIGEANLNPQTNPVVAYFDAALTMPATQPLRTINGYISNAGTPAQIYVDAVNFSILVQDNKGSLVYNFPDGTGISPNASGVAFTGFKGQIGVVQDLADDDGSDWIGYDPLNTNAVARSVQDKLRDTVSVSDFGAVGNGVADDTTAIRNAIAAQKPLLWTGSVGNTFKITGSVTQNVNADVIWDGQGATITYAGSHVEYAIRLNDTAGVNFLINDLTIDGSKLCNKALEVLNNTSNTTSSSFIANNLFLTRVKRLNTFSGGDGILMRGAFSEVTFNGGGASDCELPAGQGTPGSVGVSGITVFWYSTTSYPKRMVVNNISVNKVYSSDLAYQADQDGIRYFVPDDTSGTGKVPSQFVCNNGSSFVNCYGRSIKTQCQNTMVQNSYFERTEGLSSGNGNGEVDSQTGSLVFENNVSTYKNGFQPLGVCNSSSGATYGRPGLTASNNLVYLDSATTLTQFASTFPRDGFYSNHLISGNKIFGKVQRFFEFLCNGDKNFAEVSNNYVQEIVDGSTSEKALIYVRASGATTPRFANIIAYGNVYDNTHLPALVRDAVGGTSMNSSTSAWNNYGFLTDNITKSLTSGGLQTNVAARLGKVAAETGRAYFKVLSVNIESGATAIVPIANNSTSIIVFINTQFNATSYAIFANSSTANTVINKGAAFEFGNITNPGTGVFNIWTSAVNEISIQNTNASVRTFSLFIMST